MHFLFIFEHETLLYMPTRPFNPCLYINAGYKILKMAILFCNIYICIKNVLCVPNDIFISFCIFLRDTVFGIGFNFRSYSKRTVYSPLLLYTFLKSFVRAPNDIHRFY